MSNPSEMPRLMARCVRHDAEPSDDAPTYCWKSHYAGAVNQCIWGYVTVQPVLTSDEAHA
jgi:hypothetical protein